LSYCPQKASNRAGAPRKNPRGSARNLLQPFNFQ